MNARFVPSEYSRPFNILGNEPLLKDFHLGELDFEDAFNEVALYALGVVGGLTFVVHPLILKPLLPKATYSQRTVIGLGLLASEGLILWYRAKRKSA